MFIYKEVSDVASLYDYCKALDYCKEFFTKSLKDFRISLVVLFGSATYPGCFSFDTSDLDILALTDLGNNCLDSIAKAVTEKTSFNGSYKKPTVIRDQIGARVEFLLPYDSVAIDCTIMSSLLPDRDALLETAVYDSADLLMGAVVNRGIVIVGDKEMLEQIGNKYKPYYDDELRLRRLEVLGLYLQPRIIKINNFLEDDDPGIIDYFFRYRTVFLKYLFCHCRKFPVNFHKHLDYQASNILELPKRDRDILLLESSENWKDSIKYFVEMFERYSSRGQ